jgi:large subunit ribosomal protein L1
MSKKYAHNQSLITKPSYTLEDAVQLLLSMNHAGFKDGATVELKLHLSIDPTKSDQLIRSSAVLPHGNGKTVRVAAFVNPENEAVAKKAGADVIANDLTIEEIKSSGKINFDAAIAEPDMMKKLAPLARVLGTAGVMPSPKNGTVGTDIAGMITTLKSGKVELKNDKGANIQVPVGKINSAFDAKKLVENIQSVVDAIEKAKPDTIKKKLILSIAIKSTMSPGIRISM